MRRRFSLGLLVLLASCERVGPAKPHDRVSPEPVTRPLTLELATDPEALSRQARADLDCGKPHKIDITDVKAPHWDGEPPGADLVRIVVSGCGATVTYERARPGAPRP